MKRTLIAMLRVLWSLIALADLAGMIYCTCSRPFRVIELILTIALSVAIICTWYVIDNYIRYE